jgi:hypothetical protein
MRKANAVAKWLEKERNGFEIRISFSAALVE